MNTPPHTSAMNRRHFLQWAATATAAGSAFALTTRAADTTARATGTPRALPVPPAPLARLQPAGKVHGARQRAVP